MSLLPHHLRATALAVTVATLTPLSALVAFAAVPAIADAGVDGGAVTGTGAVPAAGARARQVTVRGPEGHVLVFVVDEAVRNLAQVKVGDLVQIDYRAAVALALMKNGDGIRERVDAESATAAKSGDRPGGALLKTSTLVADVLQVNHARRQVRLKGPEGRVVDVRVRDPQVLAGLKAGDQVVANVTETLAINVRPAPGR